ncbi:MAG: glycosyl hydrolase [Rhodospirillales bacterium]|nr:glycosyl hydrolase [Rhodospirillales bacterium]
MRTFACFTALIAIALAVEPARAIDSRAMSPETNGALAPEERARLLDQALTQDERLGLLHGIFAVPILGPPILKDAVGSAGFVPGVARLGIPPLQESDASLGVANPFNVRPGQGATPLPSGLALAASWDKDAAYQGGAMIGQEAWRSGFNVLLAGGVNLARDPRNGRNFEYLGEDPLLAGTLDGAAIRGIQDQHVVSTMKHFAMNDQETSRRGLSAKIGEAALRESDLLAFELALEGGHPGAVMCAYNRVNGVYACSNDLLLNKILKGDWGFPGWVMSDWGAVHGVDDVRAGLDQQSGEQFDKDVFFATPLSDAVKGGSVPAARISDMTQRILRSMFAVGLFDHPPVKTPLDAEADAKIALRVAEEGTVLLSNPAGLLPLHHDIKRIVVIGGHADSGVLSGGGSSQVIPIGGVAVSIPMGGEGPMAPFRTMIFDPSSPVRTIKARARGAEVRFIDGAYPSAAAALAKGADAVVVFATQWMVEGEDVPDLSLPNGQDALIEAVAAANPKTIVVLETGGPVLMPWLSRVGAVVEAWYPGAKGGEAIADILFGDINPSGRLPITFPAATAQLPRPEIPGFGGADEAKLDVDYDIEGADVGYRWFAQKALKPLFPFGFGLSFTHFEYANLKIEGGDALSVSFDVRNTGARAGADVPQLYLTDAAGKDRFRLIGWDRVTIQPGETVHVMLNADLRLLGDFDEKAHCWRIDAGRYQVVLGESATDPKLRGATQITAAMLKP